MPEHAPVPVLRLDKVDSTNAFARQRLADFIHTSGPEWIVASVQTAGKGRDARQWSSPAGGLWATLVWPMSMSPDGAIRGLGLRIGVALTEAIAAVGPAETARLKWPNDVLVDGKKIAGVLTELVTVRAERWALIGCGVNVQNRAAELPAEVRDTATSLIESGSDISIDSLLEELTQRLRSVLTTDGLDDDTLARARGMLFGVGQRARVRRPGSPDTTATLIGLNDNGQAVYRDADGSECVAEPIVGS